MRLRWFKSYNAEMEWLYVDGEYPRVPIPTHFIDLGRTFSLIG